MPLGTGRGGGTFVEFRPESSQAPRAGEIEKGARTSADVEHAGRTVRHETIEGECELWPGSRVIVASRVVIVVNIPRASQSRVKEPKPAFFAFVQLNDEIGSDSAECGIVDFVPRDAKEQTQFCAAHGEDDAGLWMFAEQAAH